MPGEARRPKAGLAALSFLVVLVLAGLALNAAHSAVPVPAPTPVRAAAASGAYFDYVVVILMENHNLCDIYTHCGGSGTFETSLADTYGIPLQYHYCNVNPSLPNYLCLAGASDFGCSGYDGGPNSNTCTATAWGSQNIVDRLESGGLTWKAYMEDMPGNCDGSDSGNYAVRHDPFVYFNDIVSNSARCNRVVPAGSSDATFLGDLASTSTASNYMWLTPNTCNDMHDCSVATGDTYLATLVPQILASTVFTTQRAALFITFDEGYGPPTFAEWAGPAVKHAFTSNTTYTHFSFLKTVEANWNLPSLTTNDAGASAMSEFFGSSTPIPDFSLSASPTSLSLVTGQTGTTTVSVSALNGFSGTVALAESSSPSGVTASCAPSSLTIGITSTCSLSATAAGSYSVTIQGTNGTLVHRTSVALTVVSPDFTISANPTSLSLLPGQTGTTTVSVSALNGFSGTVTLSTSSAPTGVVASCTPSSLAPGSTSTCSMNATVTGTYTVTIKGTSGALVHQTTLSVTVSNPDFALTTSPGTLTLLPGETGSTIVTVRAINGFSGTVTLSTSSDPSVVVATCTPGNLTPGQSATCSMNATAVGSDTVNVTGTSGALVHATSIAVTVSSTPPPPPPSTSLQVEGTLGASGWYVADVTLVLSVTDSSGTPVTIHDAVDGGAWQNYTDPLHLGDGSHTIQYYATNGAGSQEANHTESVNVDTTPPAVSADVHGTSGDHGWYTSAVQVSLSATDATSGIASITYRVDEGSWQHYEGSFNLTDGVHTLRYAATDVAGLRSPDTSRMIDVETAPPSFRSLSPGGIVHSSSVTIAWNTTDVAGISAYEVSVDGSAYRPVGLNTTFDVVLADGLHTVHVLVKDNAGETATGVAQFRVDTTAAGVAPDAWVLFLPLFIAIAAVAAIGIGLAAAHARDRPSRRRRKS